MRKIIGVDLSHPGNEKTIYYHRDQDGRYHIDRVVRRKKKIKIIEPIYIVALLLIAVVLSLKFVGVI